MLSQSHDVKISLINLRLIVQKIFHQNKRLIVILCSVFLFCVLFNSMQLGSRPEPQTASASIETQHSSNSNTSFLIIGDWGIIEPTNANFPHKFQNARAMKTVRDLLNTSFVISLGDHYYDNGIHLRRPLSELSSELSSDLQYWFIDHFENVFHPSLAPWYAILGNHDMRGSAFAQFRYSNISQRWQMPYNYYYRDFELKTHAKYRFIFIDTSSIMCHHGDRDQLDALESWSCDEAWYHRKQSKKSTFNEDDDDKFVVREVQLEWLRNTLLNADRDADIKWIFIAGHHCMWSNGPHGCPKTMGKKLRPIFELTPKIVAYFCGHNHALEHFEWTQDNQGQTFKVQTFLSGGGASVHDESTFGRTCKFEQLVDDEGMRKNERIDLQWLGISRGFLSVQIETAADGDDDDDDDDDVDGHMSVKFWDENAALLYQNSVAI